MSNTEKDIPTDEEIRSYLTGVKSSNGLTYYDENLTAPRLQAMCVEGRQKIFNVFLNSKRKNVVVHGLEDFDKDLIIKGYVVLFSIPLTLEPKNGAPPKPKNVKPPDSIKNRQHDLYHSVMPVWTGRIPIAEKVQLLADQYKECEDIPDDIDSFDRRWEFLANASRLYNNKNNPDTLFTSMISDACINLLKCARATTLPHPYPNERLPGDFITGGHDKVLMAFEAKDMGLSQYINRNDELPTENAGLSLILKQACIYLMEAKLDFCFISDFETTLLLELDFEGDTDDTATIDEQNDTPEPTSQRTRACKKLNGLKLDQVERRAKTVGSGPSSVREVPFKYRIIRSIDTDYPLRVVFCSVLYCQHLLQRNSSDPEAKAQLEAQVNASQKLRERLSRPKSKVVAEKTEKLRATSFEYITSVHKNVDKVKFENPVLGSGQAWSGHSLPQPEDDAAKTYLFDFEELNSLFPSFTCRLSSNKPRGEVVLKIYDLDYAEDRFDQESYRGYSKEDFIYLVKRSYFDEIECYERIRKHNSTASASRVNIPEIYDYGYLTFCDETSYLFGGFFILMEHVITEIMDIDRHTCRSILRSGYSQIKTLGELGISHNYIEIDWISMVDSKLFLPDFSRASCEDVPVDNFIDLDTLEEIEYRHFV